MTSVNGSVRVDAAGDIKFYAQTPTGKTEYFLTLSAVSFNVHFYICLLLFNLYVCDDLELDNYFSMCHWRSLMLI